MFNLIKILLALLQIANLQITIKNLSLQQEEVYNSNLADAFLFESNTNNISEINEIDYSFLQKKFSIEAFDSGELLQIIFMNTLNFQNEFVTCICQLLQSKIQHYIMCIDGVGMFSNNLTLQYHRNAKKYSIVLSSKEDEFCSKIFVDIENQIIAHCFISNKLNIFRINLKEYASILYQDEEILNSINCTTKLFNIQENSFLAFYNCESWKIAKVQQEKLEILLNNELINKSSSFEGLQISEIFTCQNFLYLINHSNYLMYQFLEEQFIYISAYLGNEKINSISFQRNCDILQMVVWAEQKNAPQIQFDKSKKIVKLNNQFANIEYYSIDQFILLKKEEQVNLILCQFLNQTYYLLPSKFYFIENILNFGSFQIDYPKLLYQIDRISRQFIFYEFLNLPTFIKPKKTYLFEIQRFNIFVAMGDKNINIYQILFPQYNKTQNIILTAKNDCLDELQIQFRKTQNNFPQIQEIILLNQEDKKIIKNINDEIEIYSSQFQNTVAFETKDQLLIYDIKNKKIIFQENKDDFLIFIQQGFHALFNLKTNQLKIFVCSDFSIFENHYEIPKPIKNITQTQQYLIIYYIDLTLEIYNILLFRTTYLDQGLIQFGIPIFYYKSNQITFIQYDKFLLYYNKHQKTIIEFGDQQILQILHSTQSQFIYSIHKIDDILSIYFPSEQTIIKLDEIKLQNYILIKPLIYSSSQFYISIAAQANSKKTILTFAISQVIKLVNIKFCANFNFSLQKKILIYFNEQNQLKMHFLEYYNLIILNFPKQQNYFSENILDIKTSHSLFNNSIITLKQQIIIIIINNCQKLFLNSKILYLDKRNSKLNLSELFSGPISNISVNDDKNNLPILNNSKFNYLQLIINKQQLLS